MCQTTSQLGIPNHSEFRIDFLGLFSFFALTSRKHSSGWLCELRSQVIDSGGRQEWTAQQNTISPQSLGVALGSAVGSGAPILASASSGMGSNSSAISGLKLTLTRGTL